MIRKTREQKKDKDFKKISLTKAPKELPEDMLETVGSGKQNRDENGKWDENPAHFQQWKNDMYNTKFYMQCPHCGTYMFNSMQRYSGDAWWYCFWYNRLWCYSCSTWTEELY